MKQMKTKRMKRGVGLLVLVAALAMVGTACLPPAPNPNAHQVVHTTPEAAIQAHFGDLGPGVVAKMTCIGWHESGLNPWNDSAGYYGMLQISKTSKVWENMAYNWGRPLDPHNAYDNAGAARSMFEDWNRQYGNPYGPWSTAWLC